MRARHFFALAVAALFAPAAFAQNPALAPITGTPGLPNVLLIGDSISIGYTIPVRNLLQGKANVHRIPVNGGPTSRGVEHIDSWLAGPGRPWAVIHFNFGLHDLRIMDTGAHQVAIEQYATNLRGIVARLKATGATLIWASTTPVPEGKLSPPRHPADVVRYNEAAAGVMKDAGIAVNNLYSFALPRLTRIQRPANVHFTAAGSDALAAEVAAAIARALK
jgi:acyl-CoA thioesterase-1